LARAEFERLAEREWSKLAKSKDKQALDRFHLLFSGAPQAKLAKSRIASLVANPNATEPSQHNASGHGKFVEFVNLHPVACALVWLFIGLPLVVLIGVFFVINQWDYLDLGVYAQRVDSISSGLLPGLALLYAAAFFLLRSRLDPLRPVEVVIYWFGCALSLGFVIALVFGILLFKFGYGLQPIMSIWGEIVVVSGIVTLVWWEARKPAP
jgi:hypothetical protein